MPYLGSCLVDDTYDSTRLVEAINPGFGSGSKSCLAQRGEITHMCVVDLRIFPALGHICVCTDRPTQRSAGGATMRRLLFTGQDRAALGGKSILVRLALETNI